MPDQSIDEHLRAQIESSAADHYSARDIEERIAAALVADGRFHNRINGADLAVILRNVVYYMFAHQKFAGVDVGIVHNIIQMDVTLADDEARVVFEVHIHSPIVAFLEFRYVLENDPDQFGSALRLQPGTLHIEQRTRRFDIKAKTALAAMNVQRIALQELSNTRDIIRKTLPPQLRKQHIDGALTHIELELMDDALCVLLEGEFAPLLPP